MTTRACGLQSLIEDRGRIGLRSAGVGVSGAADRAAFALANRMVGNNRTAGAIECPLGGLSVSADTTMAVAVTGADAPVTIDGTPAAHASTIWLPPGND
jgi:allophanate hydrolase subunit 2